MNKFKIGMLVTRIKPCSSGSVAFGLVGHSYVVKHTLSGNSRFNSKPAIWLVNQHYNTEWLDEDDFVLGVWPKQGDMIDVSNAKDFHEKPQLRRFFAMDGEKFVCSRSKNAFMYRAWDMARPIKKTHTVTLEDGTPVELSEESYLALQNGVSK